MPILKIRRSPRSLLSSIPALAVAMLTGCGGGGGGGGSFPVQLLAAVFLGAGSGDTTPDPGETLLLYFSGDVALNSGAILDDSDFSLPAGVTLGSGIAAPAWLDARTVRVTLAAGVRFTPGTDTLALAGGQDAVNDLSGRAVEPGTPLTIGLSDGGRPTVTSLTIEAIPSFLNGAGSAGGFLQLPRNGFSIDASYADAAFGGPGTIDAGGFWVTSSKDAEHSGNTVQAGQNLFSLLNGTPGAGSFVLAVPAGVELGEGDQTLTLTAADTSGNRSAPVEIAVRVRNADDGVRPLENGQTWFLDIGRDLDTLTSAPSGSDIVLSVTPSPNGVSDFFEELLILGLRSPTPIGNVLGGKDSNEVALDILTNELLSQLGGLYPGVSVTFTLNDPGAFPAGRALVDYNDGGAFGSALVHSRITIGADDGLSGLDALGIALFDPNNRSQENNTLTPGTYGNIVLQSRLGIFPHPQTAASINFVGSRFRLVFDPFIDHRGTPIGEDAGDAARLVAISSRTSGDARRTDMERALRDFARFLAVLVAHECGHSLGLVKDGAMPQGLFGGDAVNFPGSTAGHITFVRPTFDLFPAGATEVMSPALNFVTATDPASAFNPLILAYLRENVLYDR